MAIIDPDGLFNGDRLAKCSQAARLYWPYFFLASNGYGRIEINYGRFISRLFHSFPQQPSQSEVFGMFREYRENFLIFLYQHDGQVWGQWWTSEKYLPRHKTASDKKSPAPPVDAFTEWKNSYTSRKPSAINNFENFPKTAELFSENVRGVGVGVGVGVGGGGGIAVAELEPVRIKVEEAPDGEECFRELCLVYPKADRSLICQHRYLEAIEWVANEKRISRKEAIGYIRERAELYVKLASFQYPLLSWLEKKIFENPESSWSDGNGKQNRAEQRQNNNLRAAAGAIEYFEEVDRAAVDSPGRNAR